MKRIIILSMVLTTLLFSCENDVMEEVDVDLMVEEIKSAQAEGDTQRCAEMVYPVQYKMADGMIFMVEAEGGLKKAIGDWYKNNPESKEKPALVYPVKMLFKGKSFTLHNEKEMYKIRMACAGKKGKGKEDMKKRIVAYLYKSGISKEKMEATMDGFERVLYEAKGKGSDYQMSKELQQYFSEKLGLTDEQIAIIQKLAIRVVLSKEKGSDATGGKESGKK